MIRWQWIQRSGAKAAADLYFLMSHRVGFLMSHRAGFCGHHDSCKGVMGGKSVVMVTPERRSLTHKGKIRAEESRKASLWSW